MLLLILALKYQCGTNCSWTLTFWYKSCFCIFIDETYMWSYLAEWEDPSLPLGVPSWNHKCSCQGKRECLHRTWHLLFQICWRKGSENGESPIGNLCVLLVHLNSKVKYCVNWSVYSATDILVVHYRGPIVSFPGMYTCTHHIHVREISLRRLNMYAQQPWMYLVTKCWERCVWVWIRDVDVGARIITEPRAATQITNTANVSIFPTKKGAFDAQQSDAHLQTRLLSSELSSGSHSSVCRITQ